MTKSNFIVRKTKVTWTAGTLVLVLFDEHKKPLFSKRVLGALPVSVDDLRPTEKLVLEALLPIKRGRAGLAVVALDKARRPTDSVRRAVADAMALAQKLGLVKVAVPLMTGKSDLGLAVLEAARLVGYQFDSYLSKKRTPVQVVLHGQLPPNDLAAGNVLCDCVNQARTWLNEPPAAIHPVSLAKQMTAFGRKSGLTVTVWDERRLAKERCGGVLAVGGGSAHPPRMVVGRYAPKKATFHLVLVGKGVTFDSGGYSLKPSKSMEEMKLDMAGAAMMWGAACAAARQKQPVAVTVICPLAHNAIGEGAYNVSDIIVTRSGKTVEVRNTDAEGRLILADALQLAVEQKGDLIIDAATLTGAAVVALGEDVAAVYGRKIKQVERFVAAADEAGESFWPMPLHEAYREQLKSPVADMKNVAGPWGGSITAALFLSNFVPTAQPWMHLDIAGPGCKNEALGYLPKGGAKGFGIRAMARFIDNLQ